jgi:hypothetical protein
VVVLAVVGVDVVEGAVVVGDVAFKGFIELAL